MDMIPEVAAQVPEVFCGPTADAAFFVTLAVVVFSACYVGRLLKDRAGAASAARRSGPTDTTWR